MPSGRTKNFPESGRGLGHVTPTIFGSTVGYPSDSLASCQQAVLQTPKTSIRQCKDVADIRMLSSPARQFSTFTVPSFLKAQENEYGDCSKQAGIMMY